MSENPTNSQPPTEEATPEIQPKKKPYGRIIGALVLVALIIFGAKNYIHSLNHQSTDNAQVTGDVVLVSPLVPGTVTEILVNDNEVVKKGQVLAHIDEEKLRAAYNQAEANFQAAVADAKSAGVSIEFAQATARAAQLSAAGTMSQAQAEINTARSNTEASIAAQKGQSAQEDMAKSGLELAILGKDLAEKAVQTAQSQLESKKTILASAQAGVDGAEADYSSAKSAHDLTKQNLDRMQMLFEQGAESKSTLESAQTAEATAQQSVVAARSRVQAAQARVQQAQVDIRLAGVDLEKSKLSLKEADAKVSSAEAALQNSHQSTNVSKIQIGTSKAMQGAAAAQALKSRGDQASSDAQVINVEKLKSSEKQALAKIEQAKAALEAAQIDLNHATIIAPCDGRLTKRTVEVGSFVQVGSAMMYVVPQESLSITANFKETQISDMNEGDKVEIEVDSIKGHKFHGTVESLSAATGATFALLPPDNSTGNFVKVVQRIPVKIRIETDSSSSRLRVGLSADVTVETK